MAFPSSNGSIQISLAEAWADARSVAANIKSRAQQVSSAAAAGTLTGDAALSLSQYLADAKVQLQRDAAVSGISAYAQNQVGDPALNVAAEFTNMLTQIDAVTAWIVANFPKDGTGRLLHQTITAAGRPVSAPFAAAQTVGLRTALDGLIASIN
jgi:hypothetical protein